MTNSNIPNIAPMISITTAQAIPLLLASIAFEELSIAHIMNAEAEKMQFVFGTLPGRTTLFPPVVTLSNLLDLDRSVQRTLRDVIKKEMLLDFKFENILELISITPITAAITLSSSRSTVCALGTGDNTATLTGQVLVNGSPAPIGTAVNFSVSNPALGTVAPSSTTTDGSGNFSATFTAIDGPGTVIVTASLPAFPGVSSSVTITIMNCQTTACNCQIKHGGAAQMPFSITRGNGSADTTVMLNGVTQSPPGGVNYNGLLCSLCSASSNFFTFDYSGSITPTTISAFTFDATTFNVDACTGTTGTVTGLGTTNNPSFFGTTTPTYTITVDNTMNNKSITLQIIGPLNTFTSTTELGNGEITISNCPG